MDETQLETVRWVASQCMPPSSDRPDTLASDYNLQPTLTQYTQ